MHGRPTPHREFQGLSARPLAFKSKALVASSKMRIGASRSNARNGQPLPLTPTQVASALTNDEFIGPGFGQDELVSLGRDRAASTSESVAEGRPSRILARINIVEEVVSP